MVVNNFCFTHARTGIQCLSSDDVAIQGNMIVALDSATHGVFVRSESSPMDDIAAVTMT